MGASKNDYLVDVRELKFVLLEQFNTLELLGRGRFEDWGPEEIQGVLDTATEFALEVAGPLNAVGDQMGCRLEDGKVVTPDGFKEGFQQLYERGLKSLTIEPEFGGASSPKALAITVNELTAGSNCALDMYGGLTLGAAELIAEFGTEEQQQRYCPNMFDGTWAGTMCLTEPQAGSDVGAVATRAVAQPDGSYKISGSKLFISGGDQDLTENIIHMVLARAEGAPAGTKGLSLFIVPKLRADGSSNDVSVVGVEHKMGLNGSATCALSFGSNDACVGYLCGAERQQGMRQMFQMMNFARIGVGVQGLGGASSAYLNALAYARERKQGTHLAQSRDPDAPKVPVAEHADIRRSLLEMKAVVEGLRSMIIKAANHHDQAQLEEDDARRAYHLGQIEWLTPMIKAYGSEAGFNVTTQAIQVCGGAGFTRDLPLEQYCRDAKVFSIYEGTTHIQALDIVFRKLGLDGGAHARAFFSDIAAFSERARGFAPLADGVLQLEEARQAVERLAMTFAKWGQGAELGKVSLNANAFLSLVSDLCVGWMLLDGAAVALGKGVEADHPDANFYAGKVAVAQHYAGTVLPLVSGRALSLPNASDLPLHIKLDSLAAI